MPRRILAAALIVLSILVLVSSLAGVAGTWVVRSRLADSLTSMVATVDVETAQALQQLGRLDAALTRAREQVAAVEQQLQALGSDREDNKPLLTSLSEKLSIDITPVVARVRATASAFLETVATVNAIVENINALPFVSKPIGELERLGNLAEEIETSQVELQNMRLLIEQRRSEIVAGTVSIITTRISRIRSGLDQAQVTVSGYSQQIAAVQADLRALRLASEKWLTWTAVALTLILLWLAFSQVALLLLSWRALKGLDILPRRQQELSVRDRA